MNAPLSPAGSGPLGPFPAAAFGALGLRAGRVATVVAEAVRRARGAREDESPRVIVVGDELGRALQRAGLSVVSVSPKPRFRKRGPPQIAARIEALPLADECADAVVAVGLPAGAPAALLALARVVRDGGLIAVATGTSGLVRRPVPPEQLAAALVHAGLADIEERVVGQTLLGFGRVRKWGRIAAAAPEEIPPTDEVVAAD